MDGAPWALSSAKPRGRTWSRPTSSGPRLSRGPRRGRRYLLVVAIAALSIATGSTCTRVLIESRLLRAPYPEVGKELAWQLGVPEPAYNFGRVGDSLFRSASPDARFLRWVRERYAIQQVISLTGPIPAHEEARRLGMHVSVYAWRVESLPPPAELQEVLTILRSGERVLLHCASGADRTGYTVAALRVLDQGWPLERAVEEMRRYEHQPERWPKLHAELRELLAGSPAAALR